VSERDREIDEAPEIRHRDRREALEKEESQQRGRGKY